MASQDMTYVIKIKWIAAGGSKGIKRLAEHSK